jgi:hypothetical protein
MRTLVWLFTGIAVAVWSFLAWAAYQLVGLSGNALASNADILPVDPETIELVSGLAALGGQVGEWVVVVSWALVAGFILLVGFIVTRFLPDRRRSVTFPR